MTSRLHLHQVGMLEQVESIVRTPDRKVLSMEVSRDDDEEPSCYRIQSGRHVKYVEVWPGVYDHATMRYPSLLLGALPQFPRGSWTVMNVFKHSHEVLNKPLPSVQGVWHPEMIDILSLPELHGLKSRTRLVTFRGKQAVAKIARFDWEIQYVEVETRAYSRLEGRDVAPKFLGHLTEEGRVMGLLLEKVEGRPAGPEDEKRCRKLVKKVHDAGLIHGDLVRFNFMLGNHDVLVDYEEAAPYNAEKAQHELDGLAAKLKEKGNEGAPYGYT